MTNQNQKPSTQHTSKQNSTKNPASSTQALSVINSVTQSKNQDQRLNDESSTHLGITIRGWLPAAFGGRGRRATHLTSVDLAGGGLRPAGPLAGPGRAGWGRLR
jgi:hypothetical protein